MGSTRDHHLAERRVLDVGLLAAAALAATALVAGCDQGADRAPSAPAPGPDAGQMDQTPPPAVPPGAGGTPTGMQDEAAGMNDAPRTARATLASASGSNVTGTVTFETVDGGVRYVVDAQGFEGGGEHGFHVHENGDCSAPDATSAGGHYAPDGSPHGPPDAPADQRHLGDLGNVEADSDGRVHFERVDPLLVLEGDHSIIGRAVIVHAKADDLKSQPSGDAGPRVACGVIEASGMGSQDASGGMEAGTSMEGKSMGDHSMMGDDGMMGDDAAEAPDPATDDTAG